MTQDTDTLPKALVVSRTGTGDGGAITGSKDMIAKTPTGQPDVLMQKWPWWKFVLVRGARVYGQSFVGFIGAAAVGSTVGLVEGGNVFAVAAQLAVYPAATSLIMNAVEMLVQLDASMPKLRA